MECAAVRTWERPILKLQHNANSKAEVSAYLRHPDSHVLAPARLRITRGGIYLRRIGHPDASVPTRARGWAQVPWWSVIGFSADDTCRTPDGTEQQVLELVTDAGTLSIVTRAVAVSVVFAAVERHAARWRWSRTTPVASLLRSSTIATVAVALAARRISHRARLVLRRNGSGHTEGAGGWWNGPEEGPARRLIPVFAGAGCLLLMIVGLVAIQHDPSSGAAAKAVAAPPGVGVITPEMDSVGGGVKSVTPPTVNLPAATSPPAPAPPSLAGAAPLRSHEVFGFAPYWTLGQSSGYDLAGLTTLAYFSIGVNANGTLDESGSGWDGYQSADLAALITRAHAAGDRVVLTVNDFDQGSLDALTSSPTAPATLSAALLSAIEAKNMDGVNLDFEGDGSADQVGLTRLVTAVSAAVHGANPHYQVTMDTYASSAADPGGFYNIPALSPAVDAFFVMEYSLNYASAPEPNSPLTSTMFSDLTTAEQYSSATSPSKVILGVPFYGYDWATTDGTLGAQATSGASVLTYGQVVASGHPMYWDPITDTAWTSYQEAGQWHESFFEDPTSLYMEAQLADSFHLGGLGIWALGMDGNDPSMVAALDGFAPAQKDTLAGPTSTPPSNSTAPTTAAPTTTAAPPAPTTTAAPPAATTTAPPTTTTTTTVPPTTTTTTTAAPPEFSGTFGGQSVVLVLVQSGALAGEGPGTPAAQVTDVTTTNPQYSCLDGTSIPAYSYLDRVGTLYAEAAQSEGQCKDLTLVIEAPRSG